MAFRIGDDEHKFQRILATPRPRQICLSRPRSGNDGETSELSGSDHQISNHQTRIKRPDQPREVRRAG